MTEHFLFTIIEQHRHTYWRMIHTSVMPREHPTTLSFLNYQAVSVLSCGTRRLVPCRKMLIELWSDLGALSANVTVSREKAGLLRKWYELNHIVYGCGTRVTVDWEQVLLTSRRDKASWLRTLHSDSLCVLDDGLLLN